MSTNITKLKTSRVTKSLSHHARIYPTYSFASKKLCCELTDRDISTLKNNKDSIIAIQIWYGKEQITKEYGNVGHFLNKKNKKIIVELINEIPSFNFIVFGYNPADAKKTFSSTTLSHINETSPEPSNNNAKDVEPWKITKDENQSLPWKLKYSSSSTTFEICVNSSSIVDAIKLNQGFTQVTGITFIKDILREIFYQKIFHSTDFEDSNISSRADLIINKLKSLFPGLIYPLSENNTDLDDDKVELFDECNSWIDLVCGELFQSWDNNLFNNFMNSLVQYEDDDE